MSKKKAIRLRFSNFKFSPSSFSLTSEEIKLVEKAVKIISPIKEKYKLTSEDISNLIEKEFSIPVSIFNEKLTVLESAVKYLKQKNLPIHKIAQALGRDQRNIWNILNKANKTLPEKFTIQEAKFWIPVSIFSDSKLSALETLVSHLKSQLNLTYHEIAVLLARDDRTIWTVYSRARKKYVN